MSARIQITVRATPRRATQSLRRGAEGVGWGVLTVAALILAGDRFPRFECRVFGHSPSAWTWSTDTYEESSCRYCGISLTREQEAAAA